VVVDRAPGCSSVHRMMTLRRNQRVRSRMSAQFRTPMSARTRIVVVLAMMALFVPSTLPINSAQAKTKYPVTLGSITFSFPSKPTFTKLQVDTAAGTLDVPTYTIEGGTVAASGLSLPALTKSTVDTTLTSSANGAAANIKGTIRTSKKETYVGFPSIVIIIDVKGGTVFQRIVTDTKTKTLIQLVGVVAQSNATTPPSSYTAITTSGKRSKR
jgi:hypothetical protein